MSTCLAAFALAAPGCQSGTPPAQARPDWTAKLDTRMPEPKHIPERVRVLVSQKMQGHGDDMTVMLWAMLFLDLDSAGEFAQSIATEPRLSRPVGDADTLNALLPSRFFDLQDELKARAEELVGLSKAVDQDADAFAAAYGKLAQTCVRCHALYLREGPEQTEMDEGR